jgi:hypothetical protein
MTLTDVQGKHQRLRRLKLIYLYFHEPDGKGAESVRGRTSGEEVE